MQKKAGLNHCQKRHSISSWMVSQINVYYRLKVDQKTESLACIAAYDFQHVVVKLKFIDLLNFPRFSLNNHFTLLSF